MFVPMRIAQKSVPDAPGLRQTRITEFRGADLYNSPSSMSLSRSPDCINMIRSVPNKVRKRMGYHPVGNYIGRINGRYLYQEKEVIHAGNRLYVDGREICTELNDARSCGFCFNNRLYILDGYRYFYLENETWGEVKDIARVPRTVISKNPDGSGGTVLESINLLSDQWTESFYGTETATEYQLSFAELSEQPVCARVMNRDGVTWKTIEEGNELTVNRAAGTVTFAVAPGKSPVEGQDNVFITAARNMDSQRVKITGSDTCVTYGEAGSGARVFVTGCSLYPNRDFWSAMDDPTYFPDVNYSVLGQSNARIMGYSLLGDRLAAHKNDREGTIYVRCGEPVKEEVDGRIEYTLQFRTGNVITGNGAIARGSFASLGSEPLFLTGRGVCALTASDLTGEKYEQNRSFFIDPVLAMEKNRDEAVATVYRDFYVLAFPSGNVYLLDGLQKSYNKNQPYSNYQYECFYWNGIYARCIWTEGDMLCFGDENGTVYHFYTDAEDTASYNDNGKAIEAHWQTADLDGSSFYEAKTFRRFYIRLTAAVNTSVEGYFRKENGRWIPISEDSLKARYLRFSRLQFSKMCFSGDTAARTLGGRLNVQRVDKLAFRFDNNAINEPLGIEALAVEYTQAGRYKR